MALSASFDFTVTRDDIIAAALRKLGVLAEGQSASTNQTTYASQALNVMLKAWQSDGMPLFAVQTGYLYPLADTNDFQLASGSGNDHWTGELILTKLTADAAASATALTISITAAADVTGTIANSDFIGIELDDGTIDWTTVSAGGGTTGLTIATGLTSAASSGNRVYAYTAKQNKPRHILDIWRVEALSGTRVPVEQVSKSRLQGMQQLTEGVPTQWSYQITAQAIADNAADAGLLSVWPRFANGDYYLEIRFQHPFDDLDASTNNLSFPSDWMEAVIYGLATRLAPEYQVDMNSRSLLIKEAEAAKQRAFGAYTEGASTLVFPRMM